jgi:hypothetical protein
VTAAASTTPSDPLAQIDADARSTFAAIADHLIPAAHGMPSAGEVVSEERLRFVLAARPDLAEPLRAALRPGLAGDATARIAALERDQPANLGAVLLVVVAGYYTDQGVRDRLGYPGQVEIPLDRWTSGDYVAEGLIDAVLARGPVWRDPATGRRAERKG